MGLRCDLRFRRREATLTSAGVYRRTQNPLFYQYTVSVRPLLYVAVRPHKLDIYWTQGMFSPW
jgi:hypothetical protein